MTSVHAAVQIDDPDVEYRRAGLGVGVDWDEVLDAMAAAARSLGWDAEFELHPEHHHVIVRLGGAPADCFAASTPEFYSAVEARIGSTCFSAVDIDFAGKC